MPFPPLWFNENQTLPFSSLANNPLPVLQTSECLIVYYILNIRFMPADSKKNCHETIEKHEVVDITIKYTQ